MSADISTKPVPQEEEEINSEPARLKDVDGKNDPIITIDPIE